MINIVRPLHPNVEEIAASFQAAIDCGVVTNRGDFVRAFEAKLTAYLGQSAIVTNNGHSALLALLMAAEVEGGEVIVPSFTFSSTVHAIVMAGATPKFVDIDPVTLCLDPTETAFAVGRRTKAILAVDPYGICCDHINLSRLAKRVGVPFFIDSAPAFGSHVHGGVNSRRGDAQIFSFHATKPFSTMEGGCVASSDLDLLEKIRRRINFGQDGEDSRDVGFNGKMTEICAIVGLKQLERWSATLEQRRVNAYMLECMIEKIPGLSLVTPPPSQHPVWTYRPVMIDGRFGTGRDSLITALKKFDVNVRRYYSAVHKMGAYRSFVELPVTEWASDHVIAIPVFNDMKTQEIEQIASALRSVQEGRGY